MDPEKVNSFKTRMNALAYGNAMMAAARDYKKEMVEEERKANEARKYAAMDMDDLMDDPELEKLHEQRLAQLKAEQEKRQQMSHKGHGELNNITEGDFLEVVTKTKLVVVHFMHRDFERCKIMDKHLKELARQYFETRFVTISAPDSPFFVTKLQVQVLPCVLFFVDGVAIDRVVGFDELGGKDDFQTSTLEARMKASGVLKTKEKSAESDDEMEQRRNTVRKGDAQIGYKEADDEFDEESDFD